MYIRIWCKAHSRYVRGRLDLMPMGGGNEATLHAIDPIHMWCQDPNRANQEVCMENWWIRITDEDGNWKEGDFEILLEI